MNNALFDTVLFGAVITITLATIVAFGGTSLFIMFM